MNTAIAQHTPDVPAKGNIEHHYEVVVAPQRKAGPDLNQMVSDSRAQVYTQYTINNALNPDPQKPITMMMVSNEQKTIINDVSYANRDETPTDHKLRWSDQAFQAWSKESGTNGLEKVIQRNVVNDDTKAAMVKAHRDANLPAKSKGHWLPGSDAYDALLGSDNGRPTVYMLQQHHHALGDRKVTSIDTYPLLGGRTRAYMVINIGK